MDERRQQGRERRQRNRRTQEDRRKMRPLDGSMMDLFHRLWGQARDGVYVKPDWQEFQRRLEISRV